jgi:excisionase family DNA binding protein
MSSKGKSLASLALRPREAAEVLGISERFLWDLTRTGVVPCVRLGKGKRQAVLYPVSTLHEWLASQGPAVSSSEGEGL